MSDILQDLGVAFLGSRLKRVGERMQVIVATIANDAGLPVQPAHMPLLAALDVQAMTIGKLAKTVGTSQPDVTRRISQLVALGLVQSQQGKDQRQRRVSLTPAGFAILTKVKLYVWPQVEERVLALFEGEIETFLEKLSCLEEALDATPVYS